MEIGANSKMHVASFDLYDTIVMRRILSTSALRKSVWTQLRNSGYTVPDLSAFLAMRSEADVNSKYIDAPTFAQILEHLHADLKPLAGVIETIETNIEIEQLRCVPGSIDTLQKLRQSGSHIVFLSDMHISATQIEPKLRELGVFEDGDALLVSCDTGVSKSRKGRLFQHFSKSFNVPASHITHYGNDAWSDIKMAQKHSIKAKHCWAANPNRFEHLLIDQSKATESTDSTISEALASFSRDARLTVRCKRTTSLHEINEQEQALTGISSSIAAPVLVSFVLWVIEKCREESISTIRFLTRDGELLYQIAKALPEPITQGLHLDMLHVSRRSLLLPAASTMEFSAWLEIGLEPGAFLVQQIDLLPAKNVIARVGIEFSQHAELLSQFGITDSEKPLGEHGLRNWKRALQNDSVRSIITQESQKKLKATNAYLRQNLPDIVKSKVALVDVGWTGQQASMISALIRNIGGQDPTHLHIGRLRDEPLAAPATIHGWLFNERGDNSQKSPVNNPVALFESFCATTMGGVESYQQEPNGSMSVLRRSQAHKPNLIAWGQPTVRDCIMEFAACAGELMHQTNSTVLKTLCTNLLIEFWENPTALEARTWGSFPYEQDQAGLAVRQLAQPINVPALISWVTNDYSPPDWHAGSVALSPTHIKQLLKLKKRFFGKRST